MRWYLSYENKGRIMDAELKSEWKTPELIVLVRSKPEEAVLTTCKKASGGGRLQLVLIILVLGRV